MKTKFEIELINQVFDTLMENVGASRYHTAFPLKKVTWAFVDAPQGLIHIEFGTKAFDLSIVASEIMKEAE